MPDKENALDELSHQPMAKLSQHRVTNSVAGYAKIWPQLFGISINSKSSANQQKGFDKFHKLWPGFAEG